MARRSSTLACATALLAALLLMPETAGAAWNQPWTGVSDTFGGINQDTDMGSGNPSLAAIAGQLLVAWTEADGTNFEIRVARFDVATGRWIQPWTGVNATSGGINQDTTKNGFSAGLAGIGGVPYVTWSEDDAMAHRQVRAARLDGNTWKQPWTGVSATSGGINHDPAKNAFAPSLASVGGVPHVAWEEDDGTSREVRVARLDGNAWKEPWTGVSATSGGINQDTTKSAGCASLASINGVAHVAWCEQDGTNFELRVARLDGTAWKQPWTGVSATSGGINHDTTRSIVFPSLASAGGVPHVAWGEEDGVNEEVRVARLDGNTWNEPWTGVSATSGGINQDTTRIGFLPSLASIGGLRYVAWTEFDGTNSELRVARLEGNTWRQPWTGVSATSGAINQKADLDASGGFRVLASVDGKPYLAWLEFDGTNNEVRVARLEPEFISVDAAAGDTTAILQTSVRTYGLPYPVGFDFGPNLESSTQPTTTPVGSDMTTITQTVSGLTPSTPQQARPFALAGTAQPRVLGPIKVFNTQAPGAPPPVAPTPPPVATPPTAAVKTRATCRRTRVRGRRRVRCTIVFAKARQRRVTARLTRRGRTFASGRARSRRRSVRVTLVPRRRVTAGRYALAVTVRRPGARTSKLRLPATVA